MSCEGPPPAPGKIGTCHSVSNFKRWKIGEYGGVSGINQMKSEIYKRGPVACGIDASPKFIAYTGGIYSEYDPDP